MKFAGSTHVAVAIPAATLLVLTLLYWKLRIIDTAVSGWVSFYTGDLYNQYYPMLSYAVTGLREGRLPLWNPFQLCGVPFLAVPYVGFFYPANLVYFFVDVSTGIEIVFVLHMFLAAAGMWSLARHFGLASLGAFSAALTFAWSGWLIFNANQIPLYAGIAWMPLTVLFVDRVASGRRYAPVALIAAVTLQLLLGATETLVHNLQVGAFFGLLRLVEIARRDGAGAFFRRGALLGGCVVAGALLAAFQLLPTFELSELSNRASGLTYENAVKVSRPVWWVLFHSLGGEDGIPFGYEPYPVTGVVPFLAIFLAFGGGTPRRVWIGALILSIVSLLLVAGDPFYRVYYSLPWGALFRRPEKLLSVYQFGQALLAGVAIHQLQSWSSLPRRELWRRRTWLGAVALTTVLAAFWAWLVATSDSVAVGPYSLVTETSTVILQAGVVLTMLVMLAAYGCSSSSQARAVAIACIVVVQAANLFFATGSRTGRPVAPNVYDESLETKRYLRDLPGHYRAYLFSAWWGLPDVGFRAKDATMHGFALLSDYESLPLARYEAFFARMLREDDLPQFTGAYPLFAGSRWNMLGLTSTRYYITDHWHPAAIFLQKRPPNRPALPEFHEVYGNDALAVYEWPDVLPRAYFVSTARIVEEPDRVLDELNDPTFDASREVVLEETPPQQADAAPHLETLNTVTIDEYRAEEVTLDVFSSRPGYVVLTDVFYPGWKAFVNGVEAKIYRANYLFRAVPLEAGSNSVRFSYEPASLRTGALLSGACALFLAMLLGRDLWTRRSRQRTSRTAI